MTSTTSKDPHTSPHISLSTASVGGSLGSAELPVSTLEVTTTWSSSSASEAPELGSIESHSSKTGTARTPSYLETDVSEPSQSAVSAVNMPSDTDSTTSLSTFSSIVTDSTSTSSSCSNSTATSAAATPTCDGFHGYENYEKRGQHIGEEALRDTGDFYQSNADNFRQMYSRRPTTPPASRLVKRPQAA